MKVIVKLISGYFNLFFLKLFLIITILNSLYKAHILGNKSYSFSHSYSLNFSNIEAGYNGGSFGFSIICITCIVMYTWIEIRTKNNK